MGATLTPSPALNSSDLNHITNYSYPDSSTVTKPTLKINDSHTLNTQTNLNHNFNVIIMNCQITVPKKSQVACKIDTNDPDIIIATEIWLSSSVYSSKFFPSGYVIYRKDRQYGYGGVLLSHKCCYSSQEITLDTNCEVVACKVELPSNPLIIVAAYRPPRRDSDYFEEICSVFEDIYHSNPSATIWLGGDIRY